MKKGDLYLYFLRLGLTGFGGPIAIIAQIQKDLVEERKLIDETQFRNSFGLIKMLPGPVAVQVVTYTAYRFGGLLTALISVSLFILPACLMMVLMSVFYKEFQQIVWLNRIFLGLQGAAYLLIIQALIPISKPYFKKYEYWILFVLAFSLVQFGKLNEALVILLMGILAIAMQKITTQTRLQAVPLLELFLVCLKAGALSFGTGLAILPLLKNDFVENFKWVTQQQFLDAIALGQLTPGPISVSLTFLGHQIFGYPGAILASIGIFAPGIFNMCTWFPRVLGLFSRQTWIRDFTLGASAAISGGILSVALSMRQDLPKYSLFVPFILVLISFRWKIQSWQLLGASGISYLLFHLLWGIV